MLTSNYVTIAFLHSTILNLNSKKYRKSAQIAIYDLILPPRHNYLIGHFHDESGLLLQKRLMKCLFLCIPFYIHLTAENEILRKLIKNNSCEAA